MMGFRVKNAAGVSEEFVCSTMICHVTPQAPPAAQAFHTKDDGFCTKDDGPFTKNGLFFVLKTHQAIACSPSRKERQRTHWAKVSAGIIIFNTKTHLFESDSRLIPVCIVDICAAPGGGGRVDMSLGNEKFSIFIAKFIVFNAKSIIFDANIHGF